MGPGNPRDALRAQGMSRETQICQMMTGFLKTFPFRWSESVIPATQIKPPGINSNSARIEPGLPDRTGSGVICPDSEPPQHAPVVRMT
eukprot:12408596-Karenia_brevis.AAC.1